LLEERVERASPITLRAERVTIASPWRATRALAEGRDSISSTDGI